MTEPMGKVKIAYEVALTSIAVILLAGTVFAVTIKVLWDHIGFELPSPQVSWILLLTAVVPGIGWPYLMLRWKRGRISVRVGSVFVVWAFSAAILLWAEMVSLINAGP